MKRGLLKFLSLALSIVMLAGVMPAGAAQTVKTIRVFSIGSFSSPTGNSVLAGDINNDNKVNNKDLTRLFQYLSDWDVEINRAALDVNGDNKVNNKDLTRLFQYLSDWDVMIFPEPILCEHAGQTEIRNAKEPTCIEEGYTGDLYCLECGTLLETGSYIEKGPHTGGTATCHSKAICEVCGVARPGSPSRPRGRGRGTGSGRGRRRSCPSAPRTRWRRRPRRSRRAPCR